ncbi:hypothetical protein CP98_03684 [Sphingobium yanoikuyae]|uniref:Uncharacterized protein n=2 Tax=Sphingobium yanoikuyae TaxID=13690 RepID=A0A084EGU4_SPHYA|nr:hypothetical protein [Sphingobium yanoikuyae]KEZ17186.1 hypothetical protein CP98_03684 [Sphingobium yanoikuyae]
MTPTTLQQARENVAARYAQPYHQRAILSGQWDAGSLVRDEIAKVEGRKA